MPSRPRTAAATVLAGMFLSSLAPIGPLSLPDSFGLSRLTPGSPQAAAAPPPAPVIELPAAPPPTAEARSADQPRLTTPAHRVVPEADRGPRCDRTQLPGKRARYNGRSASQLYDRVFRPGPEMPHLRGWVPQGLTVWQNWNGKGNALVLLGMYRPGEKSYLVGLNPVTGGHVGTIRVKASHLGAIGVSGRWLIAQDNDTPHKPPAVRRYTLKKLRAKMERSSATSLKPYMAAYGKTQRIPGASYMFVEGESLWMGRYARGSNPKMYRYELRSDGRLHQAEGPWPVPRRAQGVLVTEDHFIFTTSLGGERGRMIIYRRDSPARTRTPVACLWTPSLPQNMAIYQGRILTSYESGASRFRKPRTRNKISHLHLGSLRSLLEIVDPNALHAFYAPAAPVADTTPEEFLPETQVLPPVWGASPDRAAEAIARAEGRNTGEPAATDADQPASVTTPGGAPAPEPRYSPASIDSARVPEAEAEAGGVPERISDARLSAAAEEAG